MPFQKKYTNEQIRRLYHEYKSQDKDIKNFCKEKGLPYTSIYRRFKRLANVPLTAEDVVAKTVQEEIANEARTSVQQYITLGKAVWQAVAQIATKRGIPPQELRRIPIHQMVINALEKEEQYDRLAKENKELKATLTIYKSRLDPIFRLERGIEMLKSFLEFAVVADALGIDVVGSEIAKFYEKQVERYLMGSVNSDLMGREKYKPSN